RPMKDAIRAAAPTLKAALTLALTLAIGLLVSKVAFAAGLAYAVYAGWGTTVHGTQQIDDDPSSWRGPSVDEALMRIEPQKFPFTQLLLRIGNSFPVRQVEHSWWEIGRLPRY